MMYLKYLIMAISLFSPFISLSQYGEEPLASTYSIVARDPKSGLMAVAVQSHWFSVGTLVTWGESGVGVVATQSFVNASFGPRGLDLLKEGKTPREALDILINNDPGKDVRQVAIIDTRHEPAVHTGAKCIKYSGEIIETDFSVQANMMLNENVWPAMTNAFKENKNLALPERMVRVLKAAEEAGGDIRGKQSAALLVVRMDTVENEWDDPLIDLRVDDHPEPLAELARLLRLYRAYEHMNKGDLAIEHGDLKRALTEYGAAQKMLPDNVEMKYWTAVSLANNGKVEEALPMFKTVFEKGDNWRLLTERLPEVGVLEVSDEDLNKILEIK